jgi:hypothetical protein
MKNEELRRRLQDIRRAVQADATLPMTNEEFQKACDMAAKLPKIMVPWPEDLGTGPLYPPQLPSKVLPEIRRRRAAGEEPPPAGNPAQPRDWRKVVEEAVAAFQQRRPGVVIVRQGEGD